MGSRLRSELTLYVAIFMVSYLVSREASLVVRRSYLVLWQELMADS
jgi:hypothetical protein